MRSTLTSSSWCGLGMSKNIPSLRMYGCFLPEKGPSHPSSLRRLISSCHEIGTSLVCNGHRPLRDLYHMTFKRRDRVAPSQMRCYPIFKGIYEVLSAFFKSFARCPQSLKLWNLAVKWLWVVDDLVSRLIHCSLNVLSKHQRVIIFDEIKAFSSHGVDRSLRGRACRAVAWVGWLG